MKIKELIDELYEQDEPKFRHLASLLGRVAERYKSGDVAEEDLKKQIENVNRVLEVYKIKEKVERKVLAQKVEDVLTTLAMKGVAALF